MAGYFKVKSKKKLADMVEGDRIETSDFAQITPEGYFVQLEYKAEDDGSAQKYKVKPGIFTIQKNNLGMFLTPTIFSGDSLLSSIVNTTEITKRADCFFRNLSVYTELGYDVPKRAMLLYGPAGTGKTSSLNLVAQNYVKDGKTAAIIWTTDKFESFEVKDFIKTFEYIDGVEKIILIVEDIGGVEVDQVRMKSDSSLLSILDNQEKTFKIPVLIFATTNYPEVFQGNLTNRPQRFDDKIEVPLPTGEDRQKLLSFFSKDTAEQDCLDYVATKACDKFSTAHLKESVIRSRIYEKTLLIVLKELSEEIKLYEKAFEKNKRGMGFDG
jgi:SpoVK/Ycf46/Vps4 family AAA+-type ATPase